MQLLRQCFRLNPDPHTAEKLVAIAVLVVAGLVMCADILGQFELKGLWNALVNLVFAMSFYVARSRKPVLVRCN